MSVLGSILENPSIYRMHQRFVSRNYAEMRRLIEATINRSPAGWVLDLGCGVGNYSQFIRGHQYVGADISERALRYGRRHFNGHFLVSDIAHLALRGPRFDWVLIKAVIHHANDEDALAMLCATKALLRAQGRILVVEDLRTEERGTLTSKLFVRLDRGAHFRTFSELHKLVSSEFKVAAAQRSYAWPWDSCALTLEPA